MRAGVFLLIAAFVLLVQVDESWGKKSRVRKANSTQKMENHKITSGPKEKKNVFKLRKRVKKLEKEATRLRKVVRKYTKQIKEMQKDFSALERSQKRMEARMVEVERRLDRSVMASNGGAELAEARLDSVEQRMKKVEDKWEDSVIEDLDDNRFCFLQYGSCPYSFSRERMDFEVSKPRGRNDYVSERVGDSRIGNGRNREDVRLELYFCCKR